jgi:hypothetical protein
MPSSEYYRARAEKLRMLMLMTSDPVAAGRLRGFVQRYRVLAERAKKTIESSPLQAPIEKPMQVVAINQGRLRVGERL